MSEKLFQEFKELVLKDLTVAAIREKLGEALKSYDDQHLIGLMLEILS